ncbi:MAG: glutamate 5-kinase [Candidatus Omnitrophica bacterium]|nr:glutamate 5-kinase [Candidatus Omnitrophota bacterium]
MKKRRVVVKIGSSVMTSKGCIDERLLESIVRQIIQLCKKNIDVCIVSSGAIVAGMSKLKLSKVPTQINKLQAIASIGQTSLMDIYNKHFKKYKKICGQILLTWDDFHHRERYNNAKNTFFTLFDQGVIPVVNENDTVSIEEIKFGDNDKLSALVAGLIDAEMLLLLSNVEGFNDGQKVVREITRLDECHLKAVRKKGCVHTKGGMLSKLEAADLAATLGIKTVIIHGQTKDVLTKIAVDNNSDIGTHFEPRGKISGKKKWIAFSKKPKGSIIVDSGAEKALTEKNGSLLSKGIKEVKGDFVRSDAVYVVSENKIILGQGLVNYDSDYLKKNIGEKLPQEVIHRDHLVITEWLEFWKKQPE